MKDILIPEQGYFRISCPSLSASFEYKQKVDIFEKIDRLLDENGIENQLKRILVENELEEKGALFGRAEQLRFQIKVSNCLRVNIAKHIYKCSFRELSVHLSDSGLLQWFCRYDGPHTVKLPGKSTLNEISKFIPQQMVVKTIESMMQIFSAQETSLCTKLDLSSIYADSTCVKLNIHYPVDWVLLHDAIKSIMSSIKTIRRHGLKHRMNLPDSYLKEANRLSIEMTNTKSVRKSEAKKKRKEVLRKLKALLRTVEKHGCKYFDLLLTSREKTDLSEAEAEQISLRLIKTLAQIEDIIFQAHERIIGERQVQNNKKIISLHERHVQVYKRGKASADVEFGLQLFLAESRQGFIVNFDLRKDRPQNDCKFIKPCIESLEKAGISINSFAGDRGFDSKRTEQYLGDTKIKSHIFPKNVCNLREKLQDEAFLDATKRRSQTESRIGILKNNFLGGILKAKGYNNQLLCVSWAILTHNLWILARMPMKEAPQIFAA